ncbi:hypothetical protein WDU94_011855 [Cyamophila willieti]
MNRPRDPPTVPPPAVPSTAPPLPEVPPPEIEPKAEASTDKEPKEDFGDKPLNKFKGGFDATKRRESNTSMKSLILSVASRRGSKDAIHSERRGSKDTDDGDDFDENGLPHIPHITYRKGSIISFPITDDLPCMRNKRHSITSISSTRTDTSEEVPPIAYRKGSLSVVYSIPDLLLKEQDENDEDEKSKDDFNKEDDLPDNSSTKEPQEPKFKSLDFNELLTHIGDFGTFQVYLILCMIPFIVSYSFMKSSHRFLTLVPDRYWCSVPELSNLSLEQRFNLSVPQSESGVFDRCKVYSPHNASWPVEGDQFEPDPTWKVTPCENGWEYDLDEIPYASIAVQENWVCHQSSLVVIAQVTFFLGSIVGGCILSWVADKYGRIPAVIGANAVGFVGGILTPCAQEAVLFSISRFLAGVGHFNGLIFFYSLVFEYVGPKWRTFAMTFQFSLFYTAAEVALHWIAFYLADWRWISLATSIPLLIGFIMAFFIPESARWQLATGQVDKAINTLKRIEKINNAQIDPKLYVQLKESYYREHGTQDNGKSTFNVFHIVGTRNLRRNMFVCIVVWASTWFMYHALMRQTRHFGFGPFGTTSLFGLTDFPACIFILLTLDLLGRKWLTFTPLFLSGIMLLLSTIDPMGTWSSITAIVGRLLVNISHVVCLQFSAEVLPTVVRSQGLNLMHVFGALASTVVLSVVQLGHLHTRIFLSILGAMGIISSLVSVLLPETLGKPLPETIEQGRKMREENIFEMMCCDPDDEDFE